MTDEDRFLNKPIESTIMLSDLQTQLEYSELEKSFLITNIGIINNDNKEFAITLYYFDKVNNTQPQMILVKQVAQAFSIYLYEYVKKDRNTTRVTRTYKKLCNFRNNTYNISHELSAHTESDCRNTVHLIRKFKKAMPGPYIQEYFSKTNKGLFPYLISIGNLDHEYYRNCEIGLHLWQGRKLNKYELTILTKQKGKSHGTH